MFCTSLELNFNPGLGAEESDYLQKEPKPKPATYTVTLWMELLSLKIQFIQDCEQLLAGLVGFFGYLKSGRQEFMNIDNS